ncbi:HTTM domain-containing protein [Patiriisocius marinus]|uniref:HTTM domain-containing protein n=1 Tax=Patiriisocius marinus TaxID=1397112 RepID=UPI00232E17E6|nr:HTTM domain-containing protein [Patiriisocius marinus]
MINKVSAYLNNPTSILPLAIFRMAFGFIMGLSMLRFMRNGWIEEAYVNPTFHFTYTNFEWIQPFSASTMYILVVLCAVAAFLISIGLFYRIATVSFFLLFTYLELIEKSWYLNHYYFVSLIAFLLIWLPANGKYSCDSSIFKSLKKATVPTWTIAIIKFQLSIVYFYGAIAKLKYDWLIEAQPLKIWLNAKTDIPLIGVIFENELTPFVFAWGGFLYDLIIPFLLWNRKSRPIGFILVLVFHILTHILFNIGMFPWLMIFGSLIFIESNEWRRLFGLSPNISTIKFSALKTSRNLLIKGVFVVFVTIQILAPLRHFLLTDNVLWTERGFRFSWHVMVMEKTGIVKFTVKDPVSGKKWVEYPSQRLTKIQETQMSFQPDMIWQYAKYLENTYKVKGVENPSISVFSRVSLNGRPSQQYIDENLDLTQLNNSNAIYKYISPLR